MSRIASLNMEYANKIKANSHDLAKRFNFKSPENERRMKESLNIPIAMVDVHERSPKCDAKFIDLITRTKYITSHCNPVEAIIRSYNPNLKVIPFYAELDTLGYPSSTSIIENLQKVYEQIEKEKIRGVTLSLTDDFSIKNMLKVLNLNSSSCAFDLTENGMANLSSSFRGQIRREIFKADPELENRAQEFWTSLPDQRKEIDILEKLAEKSKVYIAAGNYKEAKVNTFIFANGVQVIGALNKNGNNMHPYAYATKKVRGDFDFYVAYKGKIKVLKAKFSNGLTDDCWSSYATPYAFALSFPGAKTPKNRSVFRKIKNKLRNNSKTESSLSEVV